jgi:uncharacterized protein
MLIKPVAGTEKKIPVVWLVVMSLVIGSMTGLFGIGGGFLAVPVLVLFFKVPQGKAAGTSLAIIAINSITAFLWPLSRLVRCNVELSRLLCRSLR